MLMKIIDILSAGIIGSMTFIGTLLVAGSDGWISITDWIGIILLTIGATMAGVEAHYYNQRILPRTKPQKITPKKVGNLQR